MINVYVIPVMIWVVENWSVLLATRNIQWKSARGIGERKKMDKEKLKKIIIEELKLHKYKELSLYTTNNCISINELADNMIARVPDGVMKDE